VRCEAEAKFQSRLRSQKSWKVRNRSGQIKRFIFLERAFCRGKDSREPDQRTHRLLFCQFWFAGRSSTMEKYADRGCGVALALTPEFFRPAPFDDPNNPRPEEVIFYGKVAYGDIDARVRQAKVDRLSIRSY
jgi:hypothetical protein